MILVVDEEVGTRLVSTTWHWCLKFSVCHLCVKLPRPGDSEVAFYGLWINLLPL